MTKNKLIVTMAMILFFMFYEEHYEIFDNNDSPKQGRFCHAVTEEVKKERKPAERLLVY